MIYFIQQGTKGPIKIGYTSGGIKKRMESLQTASPDKLRLLTTSEGTERDETILHRRFRADKLHGEWFYPSNSLMSYLFPTPELTLHFPGVNVEELRKIDVKQWKEIEEMAWERSYSLDILIFHLLLHELKRWKEENNATTGLK